MFAARPRNTAIWQRMEVKERRAIREESTASLPHKQSFLSAGFKLVPICSSLFNADKDVLEHSRFRANPDAD